MDQTPVRTHQNNPESCRYNTIMAKRQPKPRSGRRGDPVTLAPLTMDQAVDAIFKIAPKDAKRVVASKPTRKKR
jgi:hypothetical protein